MRAAAVAIFASQLREMWVPARGELALVSGLLAAHVRDINSLRPLHYCCHRSPLIIHNTFMCLSSAMDHPYGMRRAACVLTAKAGALANRPSMVQCACSRCAACVCGTR